MKTTAFFIILLLCTGLTAQEFSATDYIKALHDGTLIVKLPTRSTTINAMQKLVDDPEVSPSNRERLQELIQINKEEASTFMEDIVMAFDSVYQFSDVVFVYDFEFNEIKSGNYEGIFLNNQLEKAPSIRPDKRPFFVLRFGSSQPHGSSGIESMVLQNDQREDLSAPFPYYQRINDLSALVGSILPAPDQKERDAIRIVNKLNKKLFKFYERVK
jgi:hypothetical protein